MVAFWKKNKWNKPFSERVAKRVSKIPTGDLIMWADQTITEVRKDLSNYERTMAKFALAEALSSAEALHAVVNELDRRVNATL